MITYLPQGFKKSKGLYTTKEVFKKIKTASGESGFAFSQLSKPVWLDLDIWEKCRAWSRSRAMGCGGGRGDGGGWGLQEVEVLSVGHHDLEKVRGHERPVREHGRRLHRGLLRGRLVVDVGGVVGVGGVEGLLPVE